MRGGSAGQHFIKRKNPITNRPTSSQNMKLIKHGVIGVILTDFLAESRKLVVG